MARISGLGLYFGIHYFRVASEQSATKKLRDKGLRFFERDYKTQLKDFSAGWDVKSFEENTEKYGKMYDDVRLGRETRREVFEDWQLCGICFASC